MGTIRKRGDKWSYRVDLGAVNGKREIDDLEHAIELVKANAVQRCFLENELKKARKIRRECKDAMSLIEMVLKFNLDDWGTGRVQSEIVRLETRCYTPKVRDDIFV